MQLTGEVLTDGLSEEERQERLRLAMAGRKVLLVLDDLWERVEQEERLNFADDSSGSKVLISSRVRGVLEGADIVEVGVPSEEDAVAMLLQAAGVPAGAAVPPGARQIVAFCNRLPLAIAMSAKLVKGMSLESGSDWEGVLEVMRQVRP